MIFFFFFELAYKNFVIIFNAFFLQFFLGKKKKVGTLKSHENLFNNFGSRWTGG